MATSTNAFFLLRGIGSRVAGTGLVPVADGPFAPEVEPQIIWGQGTPAGTLAPWTLVNKGSMYIEVNRTDDLPAIWQKVDEGNDAADWVLMDHKHITTSTLFDISASDSEQVVMYADRALLITSAYLLWEEATGASGAAEGDITIGTATGGAEIVAAAAYSVSKATGSIQSLTLVDGAVAAAGSVFASHDQAASASGTYRLVLVWQYTA